MLKKTTRHLIARYSPSTEFAARIQFTYLVIKVPKRRRPLSPCNQPGCPDLSSSPYCPLHQKRKPSGTSGYDKQWNHIRREHLKYSPYCVVCGAVATQVDHVRTRRDHGEDAYSNLASLCHSHHSYVTNKYDGGFGNRRDPEGKIAFYRELGLFFY